MKTYRIAVTVFLLLTLGASAFVAIDGRYPQMVPMACALVAAHVVAIIAVWWRQ